MSANFTISVLEPVCHQMVIGDCGAFVSAVAEQVGRAVLPLLVAQTVQVIANYSSATFSYAREYMDYTKLPLEDLKEMYQHLRGEAFQMSYITPEFSLQDQKQMLFVNKTLQGGFERAESFVRRFTESVKKERDEGVMSKIWDSCSSMHKLMKDRSLGAYKACQIKVSGYLVGSQ